MNRFRQTSFSMTRDAASAGAVSALVLVLMTGCGQHDSPPRSTRNADAPPCSARVEPVQSDSTDRVVRIVGVVEPVRRASPAARVMARVTRANFHEGERVTEGQVLVQLDTRDLGAVRRRARAARNATQTALGLTRTHLERMRALHATGDVSRPQVEQAEAAFAQAEAAAATAEAAVDEVDVNISYARVLAPFDGVIARKMVEVGNLVAPGQPVAVLEDDGQLRIVAPIGSDLARYVVPEGELSVEIAESRVSATVEGAIPSGDLRAPGLRLQLVVDNPGRVYQAGMVATVELPRGGDGVAGVRIPSDALFERGQLTGVFVVNEESEARLRWVVIDDQPGDSVRVLSGLRAGERVAIAADAACLADGRRVTPVNR